MIRTLLLSSLLASTLSAQNPARSGKDYAVFFYVTTFQPGWESLPETAADAKAIGKELKDNYGFSVEYVANPTKADIENKILELNRRSYGQKDQLLLYFSMHGHFIANADRGYLIPADGKTPPEDPLGRTWLSYDDLGAFLSLNPCQHILLSLDACYSGTFGDRWMSYPGSVEASADQECKTREEFALYHESYLYFTSGSREKRTPAQSKFAGRWLKTLQDGREKKVVTTNDLRYNFGTIENPKPEGGAFSRKENGGDFIFIHNSACKTLSTGDKDQEHWLTIQQDFTKENVETHLELFPYCQHQTVLNSLGIGFNTVAPDEVFPSGFEYFSNDMVLIEGGEFEMGEKFGEGGTNERPLHRVKVKNFYLNRFEVTQKQWKELMDSNPSHFKGCDNCPVENVSWDDAQEYIKRLNEKTGKDFRLPTETEWEYATFTLNQTGMAFRFPNDKMKANPKEMNFHFIEIPQRSYSIAGEFRSTTVPVNTFSPNAFGLYNMSGNVWEWCKDVWHENYDGAPNNGSAWLDGGEQNRRVIRGGSWNDEAFNCRSSYRYGVPAMSRNNTGGFRLARSAR